MWETTKKILGMRLKMCLKHRRGGAKSSVAPSSFFPSSSFLVSENCYWQGEKSQGKWGQNWQQKGKKETKFPVLRQILIHSPQLLFSEVIKCKRRKKKKWTKKGEKSSSRDLISFSFLHLAQIAFSSSLLLICVRANAHATERGNFFWRGRKRNTISQTICLEAF